MIWQLNKIQYPLYNLGPGKRIGIWVQGCTIHCNDCINRSLWDPHNGKQVEIPELFSFIKQLGGSFQGITITGGEPFDQYPQLMAFSLMIKRHTHLDVMVYTGYSLDALFLKYHDETFTSNIDYLIDGPYCSNLPADDGIRGSSNQNMYCFSGKKAIACELSSETKQWSLCCSQNTVYMAGVPLSGEMESLQQSLLDAGIVMQHV